MTPSLFALILANSVPILGVLFGGWFVMLLGSPLPALIVLVVIKTLADVRAHQAEQRKFAPSPEPMLMQAAR
ncbi:MAG TPA: DUF6498-containing protein [Gemmatimonadales bacterium]|nr:DUF6498-containing protein [Gemmatimonadales bacterium]